VRGLLAWIARSSVGEAMISQHGWRIAMLLIVRGSAIEKAHSYKVQFIDYAVGYSAANLYAS
jgi:hypothetical protein